MKVPTDQERRERLASGVVSARASRGISQKSLALGIGVDVKTIGRIEKAKMLPNLSMVYDLAAYLGVSIATVIGQTEESPVFTAPLERSPALGPGDTERGSDEQPGQLLWQDPQAQALLAEAVALAGDVKALRAAFLRLQSRLIDRDILDAPLLPEQGQG